MPEKLLEISNLRTYFFTEAGVVRALDGMSLEVYKGQAVGLVGESGSGKSVTAQSVLRIVPRPGRIVDGSIRFDGEDLQSQKTRCANFVVPRWRSSFRTLPRH